MDKSTLKAEKELYLRLLSYVLPHWRMFALSLVTMLVTAATEPAFAALLKPMLDGSFVGKDLTMIRLVPLLLVALFLVRGVASVVSTYAISWVANRLVMDLRDLMFRKLVTLPTKFYDNSSSGTLISKLAYDVTQVTNAATSVQATTRVGSVIQRYPPNTTTRYTRAETQ